jgi:hypothetical protein
VRDHNPIPLEEFNGYFNRGGKTEDVPQDHFIDVLNIQFGESFIETRLPIVPDVNLGSGNNDVVRVHEYTMQTQRSHLILNTSGEILHRLASGTVQGPVLTIAAMTDFNVVSFNGRAYITPFFTNSNNQQVGLQNEFLYVYKGDGTAARKAAGTGPPNTPAMSAANGAAGFTDAGIHLFAAVFETDTGFLTSPGAFVQFTTSATNSVSFSSIPVSGSSFVTNVHIVATRVITSFNGDFEGYEYFFIPGATVTNGTTTLANQSFYDRDLIENASHLFDIFEEIPAGVALTSYHNCLVLTTTFSDISVAYVSFPGEPEAIHQVDGLLIVPLDGKPITNAQELRDVLYIFKSTLTVGYSDNEDVPSTWQPFTVDEANGTSVHGIGTVLDAGGVNIDYLVVAGFSGIRLFNGNYPELNLSWKIDGFWTELETNQFNQIEIVIDNIHKIIYCTLPLENPTTTPNQLLIGDYQNGLNPKDVRWSFLSFNMPITTVDMLQFNTGLNTIFGPLLGFRVNISNQCGLYIYNNIFATPFLDVLRTNVGVESNNIIPTPFVTFGYQYATEKENIAHVTGFKIRIQGLNIVGESSIISEPVVFSLFTLPGNIGDQGVVDPPNETILQQLDPSLIPTGREPVVLANFNSQRFALQVRCVAPVTLGRRYFRIHRIVFFVKEIYTMYPA